MKDEAALVGPETGAPDGTFALSPDFVRALILMIETRCLRLPFDDQFSRFDRAAVADEIIGVSGCVVLLTRSSRWTRELWNVEEVCDSVAEWVRAVLARDDARTIAGSVAVSLAAAAEALLATHEHRDLMFRNSWLAWARFDLAGPLSDGLAEQLTAIDGFARLAPQVPGLWMPADVREYLVHSAYRSGPLPYRELIEPIDQTSINLICRAVMRARRDQRRYPHGATQQLELLRAVGARAAGLGHPQDLAEAVSLARDALARDRISTISLDAGEVQILAAPLLLEAQRSSDGADSEALLFLALTLVDSDAGAETGKDVASTVEAIVHVLGIDLGDAARAAQIVDAVLERTRQPGPVSVAMRHAAARATESLCDAGLRPRGFDEAESLLRDVLSDTRPYDSEWSQTQRELSDLWHARWKRTNEPLALHRAVQRARKACSGRDPDVVRAARVRLSHLLAERSRVLDHHSDDAEHRALLARLVADGATDATHDLIAYSNALITVSSDNVDLHRGIVAILFELAADPHPVGEPSRARRLANLARACLNLYEVSDEAADLAHAEESARMAIDVAGPTDHGAKFVATAARMEVAVRQPSGVDLLHIDSLAEVALRNASDDDEKTEIRRMQMVAAGARFVSGDRSALRTVIGRAKALARDTRVNAPIRRSAASLWAQAAGEAELDEELFDACRILVETLGGQNWTHLSADQRRDEILRYQLAARDGADAAVRCGRPRDALLLLEAGLNVEWRHRLHRTTSLSQLRDALPHRRDRIDGAADILRGLDHLASPENFTDYMRGLYYVKSALRDEFREILTADPRYLLDEHGFELAQHDAEATTALIVDHSQDLRMMVDADLEQMRFELDSDLGANHPSPSLLDELLPAIQDGVIVVAMFTGRIGRAFIIGAGGVTTIDLPSLEADGIERFRRHNMSAMYLFGEFSPEDPKLAAGVVDEGLAWLWESLARPVLDAAGLVDRHDAWTAPRVWWCLTGALAGFPVHAATEARSTGSDSVRARVVSSHISSLTAFAEQLAQPRPGVASGRAVVIDGGVAVAKDLPHARTEARDIRRILERAGLAVDDGGPDLHSIANAVDGASVVHAACHGLPFVHGKVPGGLQTRAGLLSTTRLKWLDAQSSDLAYLSVCHAALAMTDLPDESEHLAATFAACGFRHVVGTWWAVNDQKAHLVAQRFYAGLVNSEARLDVGRSARALRAAVDSLGAGTGSLLWGAFVHYGP